jgi:hypothetical protein|nr:MAG TPA: Hydantoinase/oxoprolinase [Caudoviricetes sp.]
MITVYYNFLASRLILDDDLEKSLPDNKNEIMIDSIKTNFFANYWGGSTNVGEMMPNSFTICSGYSYLNPKHSRKVLKIIETYFKHFDIDYKINIEPSRFTLKRGKKNT